MVIYTRAGIPTSLLRLNRPAALCCCRDCHKGPTAHAGQRAGEWALPNDTAELATWQMTGANRAQTWLHCTHSTAREGIFAMAGTNFITRTNILNSSYPDDARKRRAWTVETNEFIARVHETDLGTYGMGRVRDKSSGEKQTIAGGGYVGVSFRPRSEVLSLGTPHDAMSPELVAWGLNQLKKNSWFIRLDPYSEEIEGEVRKNLFATAFSRATNNSVGLDSSGGIFAPNYVEDAAQSRRDVRRRYEAPQKGYGPLRYEVVRDALRWVEREVSAPTGNYAIRRGEKIARDQIHDAARAAIYAYVGDRSTLVDRALSAAEAERDKIASNL